MAVESPPELPGTLLDDRLSFSFREFCQVCGADGELVILLVEEGVLEPHGTAPDEWRFSGHAVTRARRAMTLARDLRVNWPGAALALDLLEEIDRLRLEARQVGVRRRSGRDIDR